MGPSRTLLKTVSVLVAIILVITWVALLAEPDAEAAAAASQIALADSTMDSIQFRLYDGKVYLPPIHFDWIMDYEQHILRQLEKVVCVGSASSIVVDVGANDGIYSLLAAATRGCRVQAFEMQRSCVAIAAAAARLNDLDQRIVIHQQPVSNVTGQEIRMAAGEQCLGTMSVTARRKRGPHDVLRTTTLDAAFAASANAIAWLKVDAEGHESEIIEGARQLFIGRRIASAVVESHHWRPGIPNMQRVAFVLHCGYCIQCMRAPDAALHGLHWCDEASWLAAWAKLQYGTVGGPFGCIDLLIAPVEKLLNASELLPFV
jgi:FkbM family methyltransferase